MEDRARHHAEKRAQTIGWAVGLMQSISLSIASLNVTYRPTDWIDRKALTAQTTPLFTSVLQNFRTSLSSSDPTHDDLQRHYFGSGPDSTNRPTLQAKDGLSSRLGVCRVFKIQSQFFSWTASIVRQGAEQPSLKRRAPSVPRQSNTFSTSDGRHFLEIGQSRMHLLTSYTPLGLFESLHGTRSPSRQRARVTKLEISSQKRLLFDDDPNEHYVVGEGICDSFGGEILDSDISTLAAIIIGRRISTYDVTRRPRSRSTFGGHHKHRLPRFDLCFECPDIYYKLLLSTASTSPDNSKAKQSSGLEFCIDIPRASINLSSTYVDIFPRRDERDKRLAYRDAEKARADSYVNFHVFPIISTLELIYPFRIR